MKFSYLTLLSAAFLFALSSCATTGDPNEGGYLGWSKAKAQQRQDDLRGELDISSGRGQELKAESRSLENRKASLRKQIAAATERSRNASSPEEKKSADQQIANLNQQLRRLESL